MGQYYKFVNIDKKEYMIGTDKDINLWNNNM